MDARFVVLALLAASAGLAGCTASAELFTTTGQDAYAKAEAAVLEDHPQATLLAMRGFEGRILVDDPRPQWVRETEAAEQAQDEALGKSKAAGAAAVAVKDQELGDGKAPAWKVLFLTDKRVIEVLVTEQDVKVGKPFEPAWADEHDQPLDAPRGASDISHWDLTSSDVAAKVAANGTFARHIRDYPGAAWTYTYVPYGPAHRIYDWSGFHRHHHEGEETAPEAIGWRQHGNVWIVDRLDAKEAEAGGAPRRASAVVDAATGVVLEVVDHVPRIPQPLFALDENHGLAILLPPRAETQEEMFEVPQAAGELAGYLGVYGGPGDYVVRPLGSYGELLDPSGNVRASTEDGWGFVEFSLQDPEPGTWTVRVGRHMPSVMPISAHAEIWGTVPFYTPQFT